MKLISLSLCLRLVKNETAHKSGETVKFNNQTYVQVVYALLQNDQLDHRVLKEVCDNYLNKYYDLQYYFLLDTAYPPTRRLMLICRKFLQNNNSSLPKNLHTILSSIVPLFPLDETIPQMFTPLPNTTSILLPSSYKVAFQSVWLAHLRHPLSPAQLKQIFLIIHKRIIPYMNKPQMLMDWLTDSYNSGRSLTIFLGPLTIRWKYISSRIEWTVGVDAETQS